MRVRIYSRAIVVLVTLAGCHKTPTVGEVSITPSFFCSGDHVTFTAKTTNIDELTLIGTGTSPVSVAFPPDGVIRDRITQTSEAPFDITGKIDGTLYHAKDLPAEYAALQALAYVALWTVNLDNDTWHAPMGLSALYAKTGSYLRDYRDPVTVDTTQCTNYPNTQMHTVNKIKKAEWDTATQFSYELTPEMFGPKAKLIGVENCSDSPSQVETITGPFPGPVTVSKSAPKMFPGKYSPAGFYNVTVNQPVSAHTKNVYRWEPPEVCNPPPPNQPDDSLCQLARGDGNGNVCGEIQNNVCLKLYIRCE